MDYSQYLPYLEDSVDKLLDHFQTCLLQKTTYERCLEIRSELRIYLDHFKRKKDQNPDKAIDDHIGSILLSYMLNPNLDIMDRDAHYNGVWYALWGNINKQKINQVKAICAKKNPGNERWTQVCLSAVDEYYKSFTKPSLLEYFKGKIKKKSKPFKSLDTKKKNKSSF